MDREQENPQGTELPADGPQRWEEEVQEEVEVLISRSEGGEWANHFPPGLLVEHLTRGARVDAC